MFCGPYDGALTGRRDNSHQIGQYSIAPAPPKSLQILHGTDRCHAVSLLLSYAELEGQSAVTGASGSSFWHAVEESLVGAMTETSPLVSVVIPAYNAAETLERAIVSVLRQTYEPLQIVVVDDASDDATLTAARSFKSQGVESVRLPRRLGAAAARNHGISLCQGEYIAFLDADDAWHDSKIGKQIVLLRDVPDMAFIACAARLFPMNGSAPRALNAGRRPSPGPDAWKELLTVPIIATPSVIARRLAILDVGGFNPALEIAEDQDLWIRLARHGHCGYLGEVLVDVHERPDSLSARTALGVRIRTEYAMVSRYLEDAAYPMTKSEKRGIWSRRFLTWANAAHARGKPLTAVKFFLRAAAMGNSPLWNTAQAASVMFSVPPLRRVYALSRTGKSSSS